MEREHPKNPIEAEREGLEQLERAPHHPTTEHDKPGRAPDGATTQPPGELHRGGPLPDHKR
jgi:hypothetical protein